MAVQLADRIRAIDDQIRAPTNVAFKVRNPLSLAIRGKSGYKPPLPLDPGRELNGRPSPFRGRQGRMARRPVFPPS